MHALCSPPHMRLTWRSWGVFAGAVFLLSLTFTHTVALRLSTLFLFALYAAVTLRSRQHPITSLSKPFVAWSGVALASVLWAIDPLYSLNEIKNEIFYTLVAFFSFYSVTENETRWRHWNILLIAGFFLTAFSGVFAYWIANDFWRKGGVHGGVGDYSTYLVTIMPMVLYWHVRRRMLGITRVIAYPLIPLLLIGAFLTMNRAFWPALVSMLIVFGTLYYLRNRHSSAAQLIGVGIVLLVVLATSLFATTIMNRAASDATHSEILVRTATEDPRLQIWRFAWAQIREQPLMGAGFGRAAVRETMEKHFDNDGYEHAHNIVLNYALQMGVLGITVLVIVFAALAREYWSLYVSGNSEACLIGILGLAMITGVLVKNMTDDFFYRQHALLFWSIAGMSLGYAKRQLRTSRPRNHQRRCAHSAGKLCVPTNRSASSVEYAAR